MKTIKINNNSVPDDFKDTRLVRVKDVIKSINLKIFEWDAEDDIRKDEKPCEHWLQAVKHIKLDLEELKLQIEGKFWKEGEILEIAIRRRAKKTGKYHCPECLKKLKKTKTYKTLICNKCKMYYAEPEEVIAK